MNMVEIERALSRALRDLCLSGIVDMLEPARDLFW